MKTDMNFQECIGKFVRFEYGGLRYGQITNINEEDNMFSVEIPTVKTMFLFDRSEEDIHKTTSIIKVLDSFPCDDLDEFEEVSKEEYSGYLYDLLQCVTLLC